MTLDAGALTVEQEVRTSLEEISKRAQAGCGLVYELYIKLFSREVDGRYANTAPEVRDFAYRVAKEEYDYISPAEVEALDKSLMEEGLCSHGLDSNTCPCGCFENDGAVQDEASGFGCDDDSCACA